MNINARFTFQPIADDKGIARAGGGDDTMYRASVSSENSDIYVGYYDEKTDQYLRVRQVLLHGEENIDLSVFANRAPILFNHNSDQNIGQVRNATIDAKRLVADFQVSPSAFAREKQQEIDAGFLWSMSIGAAIQDTKLEPVTENGETAYVLYITKWQPYEASVVNTPADASVGINRELSEHIQRKLQSIPKGEKPMNPTENQNPTTPTADPNLHRNRGDKPLEVNNYGDHDLEKSRKDGATAERDRIIELETLAEATPAVKDGDKQALLRDAKRDGIGAEEFAGRLLRWVNENPDKITSAADLDLSPKELKQYRLANLIDGLFKRNYSGLEFECADEISRRKYGDDHISMRGTERSVVVPLDVLNDTQRGLIEQGYMAGSRIQREVSTGNAGELVGTLHDAGSYIGTLRDRSVIMNLGALIMGGLVGSIDIPQKETNAVFGWVDEGDDGNTTDITFGTKQLRIKTASGGIGFTRRMVQQGTPLIEPIVYNDLIDGAALLIDTAAIAGTGAGGQPTGILNTDGINSITWTAADGIQWQTVVNFATKLAEDNALRNDPAFILTPAFYETMQVTKKDAGSGIFLLNESGRLNGYRVARKTGDLGDNILFGDFRQLLIGFWEMLELSLDSATKAASGGTIVRAWIDMDVNVRHAVSFVKGSQA